MVPRSGTWWEGARLERGDGDGNRAASHKANRRSTARDGVASRGPQCPCARVPSTAARFSLSHASACRHKISSSGGQDRTETSNFPSLGPPLPNAGPAPHLRCSTAWSLALPSCLRGCAIASSRLAIRSPLVLFGSPRQSGLTAAQQFTSACAMLYRTLDDLPALSQRTHAAIKGQELRAPPGHGWLLDRRACGG